jgi:hypothetical protein
LTHPDSVSDQDLYSNDSLILSYLYSTGGARILYTYEANGAVGNYSIFGDGVLGSVQPAAGVPIDFKFVTFNPEIQQTANTLAQPSVPIPIQFEYHAGETVKE